MFLAGTRYVSHWLNLGGGIDVLDVYKEGSPIDRAVFTALIIAGGVVLYRRKLDWDQVLVRNKWICLFFLYCAMSIAWSDDPFVSLKRWIKFLGTPIMVLVVLTEERPFEAVGTLLRRFAFLVIPLSVLFIRYYPDLGRAYHMGMPMFTGVATHKNELGQACLISSIYFSWSLIFKWHEEIEKGGNIRVAVSLLFLVLLAWLFYMADSATSVMCWLVVLCFFVAGRIPALASEPRKLVLYGASVIALLGVLEYTIGISDAIISGLGRRKDLTTRVPMWDMLLSGDTNPLIGVGYENFWSGERLEYIWRKFPGIIQAHNGYLDLYLNIGMIGLLLFFASIISGFVNTIKLLDHDYAISVLRIAFIIAVVLTNWTEATIKPVAIMFVILLFGIMDVSSQAGLQEDSYSLGDREYEPE
jgi:O-antigen ligase